MWLGVLTPSWILFTPAAPPTCPIIISRCPDGLNFITRCAATSTVQILVSASARMPCALVTGTSVQAFKIFPDLSNTITGCAPRLNTQMLSFLSTVTPAHSPKFQPLGNCAQSGTTEKSSGGPDLSSAN